MATGSLGGFQNLRSKTNHKAWKKTKVDIVGSKLAGKYVQCMYVCIFI